MLTTMQIIDNGNGASHSLDVSVIICAYTLDRWEDLNQAIRSIEDQTIRPFEIILVIDHNPELFGLAQERFTGVKVLENQESKGLSGARNTGIAHAQGEIVAFMDEDAIAYPEWMEHLLSGYEDAEVLGVGGKIEPNWLFPKPDWFPEEFNWVIGCSYKGLTTSLSPVRNLIGCNMSFRREVFSSAGGFRVGIGRVGTLPVGCEETEFCIRARQGSPSMKYLYHPDAIVAHNVPKWRINKRYFLSRCYAEGISKALVTGLVGAGDGLESERRYTLRALPQGIALNLSEAFLHGRLAGLKRAVAILVGLAVTTLGYGIGLLFHRRSFISLIENNSPNRVTNQGFESSKFNKGRQSSL